MKCLNTDPSKENNYLFLKFLLKKFCNHFTVIINVNKKVIQMNT